jgi:hypothetical protein
MYDYYDEEPYYEPTVADEIFMEYQAKLKDVLKESIKLDIENIKSENTRLKEENKKLRDKNYKVEAKEIQLADKEKNLEYSFYKKKFSEILKPFEEHYSGYYADHTYKMKRKCNQCDENRQITYTAPNGDTVKKDCSCKKNYSYYVPKSSVITVIDFHKSDGYSKREFGMTPKYENKDDDYRWSSFKFTQFIDAFDESIAEEIKYRDTLFSSKEECKKFCDWLNKNFDEDDEEICIPKSK